MSNVIIGIIGIILFIGLSVAGAVYLGPRFKSVKNNSDASAIASSMGQIAFAVQTKNIRDTAPATSGNGSDLVPRFLKSLPRNPLNPTAGFDIRDTDGTTAGTPAYVILRMTPTPQAAASCTALAFNSGQPVPADGTIPKIPAPLDIPQGCGQLTATWGTVGSYYIAWRRI